MSKKDPISETTLLAEESNYGSIPTPGSSSPDSSLSPNNSTSNANNTHVSITAEAARASISTAAFQIILLSLFCIVYLSSLDSTMVSTLLSTIASDLHTLPNISWVATSYLLSCAAFQPLFGKISNVFGRKPVILACSVMFGFGCLLSGISSSFWALVAGRFITGIGGGGFNTMATISLSDIVPVRQRGLYQGYVNIFFHLGATSGGLVAGFFQEYFGWRAAFLIQVPICILTGSLVYWYFNLPEGLPGLGELHNTKHLTTHTLWSKLAKLDIFGSTLLVVSLFLILLAASLGGKELAYSGSAFQLLLWGGIALLVGFYFYELRVAEQPVIPVTLLHHRSVACASIIAWFVSANMFASLYYIPFYWQSVRNLTPLQCGVRLIPSSAVSAFASISAGYFIKRFSKYMSLYRFANIVILLGSIVLYSASQGDSYVKDLLISVPLRYGNSTVITIVLVAMISAVDYSEQALVTSIQYGFRSTGSTLGVSIASAVLQFALRRNLTSNFDQLANHGDGVPDELKARVPFILKQALHDPSFAFSEKAPFFFKKAIVDAYDTSLHGVFGFIVLTGVLSFVTVLFDKENNIS